MLKCNKVEITDYSFTYHTDKGKITVGSENCPVSTSYAWKGSDSYKEFTIQEAIEHHAKNLNIEL